MDILSHHIYPAADYSNCLLLLQPNGAENPHKVHLWMAATPRLILSSQCFIWPLMHIMPKCPRNSQSFYAANTQNKQQSKWKDIDGQLLKYFLHHQINSTFHDLFHGLLWGCQASPGFDPWFHLTHPLHHLYGAQCNLGWQQLYYGHLSPLWVSLHSQSHPTINGLHYYTKLSWHSFERHPLSIEALE